MFERNKKNDLLYNEKVVFAPNLRNKLKFIDKKQKFDVEMLLCNTDPIIVHKSDAQALVDAKERYKEELEAAFIIKKYEILEELEEKKRQFLEVIKSSKLSEIPFYMIKNALKIDYSESNIKIDQIASASDFPTLSVLIDNETYTINQDSLHQPKKANKDNLTFVRQLQRLYNFHYIHKIG